VGKVERYRQVLRELDDWDTYLLHESGLPGPRGNIELARAVAEEGDAPLFARYLEQDAQKAPTNTPQEFLAFCGVLGLGRLLAEGNLEVLPTLRKHASDPRWRTREAVAMALQHWGRVDMCGLLCEMDAWSCGSPFEQRAAAAALCEPGLLTEERHARQVLEILDGITASLSRLRNRRTEGFKTLRKGLGYCWSVAVVGYPTVGEAVMEKWLTSEDRDVRWIMRSNLKKKRLARIDPQWVAAWQAALEVP